MQLGLGHETTENSLSGIGRPYLARLLGFALSLEPRTSTHCHLTCHS